MSARCATDVCKVIKHWSMSTSDGPVNFCSLLVYNLCIRPAMDRAGLSLYCSTLCIIWYTVSYKAHITLDWLQSLKQFFTNVSYHIHVASLTLMAHDTLMKNCFKDWSQSNITQVSGDPLLYQHLRFITISFTM